MNGGEEIWKDTQIGRESQREKQISVKRKTKKGKKGKERKIET